MSRTTAQRSLSRHTSNVERLKAALPYLPPRVARPVLRMVSGPPGSGKSHFSRRLVERVPLLVLESDVLRKTLFPAPTYGPEESAALFDACYILIDKLLRDRVPVLLDATNLLEQPRERLHDIAERAGAKLLLVSVTAPTDVVRQRLADRSRGADPDDSSIADWQVYQRMLATAEPIRREHFLVDTSRDIMPALARVVREIDHWAST